MLDWFVTNGSNILFAAVLVVCGLGVPIPEDIVLLAAGAVTHRTDGSLWVTVPIVVLAVLGGDSLLFFIARRLGPRMLTLWPFRWFITPARRERVRTMFEKRGAIAILIGRHVAGLRPCVFAMAGIEGMPFRKFILWDTVGACISVPAFTLLGYFGSESLDYVHEHLTTAQHYVVGALVIAVVLFIVYRLVKKRFARKTAVPTVDSIPPPGEHEAP